MDQHSYPVRGQEQSKTVKSGSVYLSGLVAFVGGSKFGFGVIRLHVARHLQIQYYQVMAFQDDSGDEQGIPEYIPECLNI